MVGRTISHYRIVAQLGSGGMGTLYRAEDVRLGREVALKFVADDLAHELQAVRRLRSEARAASALNHRNICTVYDIDEHDGHPFIVMELMKGRTLRDRLATGPLRPHQLVDIGIEVADALHTAHSEGIIHRDIKPANIFLTERGHVKVLDFGLAKMAPLFTGTDTTQDAHDPTAAGVTLGTISYMSPEQAAGEELDGRTDLFSLGVVLYECATGRHPFPGRTSAVVLAAILNRAPQSPLALNPELPLRLQDVIVNCLEKDRELRYQSAADLRADLKRVRRDIESGQSQAVTVASGEAPDRTRSLTPASGTPVASVSTGTSETSRLIRSGSRALLAGAAVATLIGLSAAAYVLWKRAPAVSPPGREVAAGPSEAVRVGLARAKASIEARDYRAALTSAADVLAIDAANTEAAKIQAEARATLGRSEAAVAEARERIAVADLQGADEALDKARAIDPTAPGIREASSRLAELRQKERADQAVQRGQAADPAATKGAGPPPRASARSAPQHAPQPRAPALSHTAEPAAPQVAHATAVPPVLPAPPVPAPAAPDLQPPPPAPATPSSNPAGTVPAAAPPGDSRPTSAVPAPREADEADIRRLVALYARAIEGKDLALFRSIKPNLTREEERRLKEGFQAVTSQRVSLTIVSTDVRASDARVVLRRRDTIEAGGRQQTNDSHQTLTLKQTGGGWTIVDIR